MSSPPSAVRGSVACTSCRIAKRQCITSEGQQICQRCKSLGKTCVQPEPGTSSYHRQPKLARRAILRAANHQQYPPYHGSLIEGPPAQALENVPRPPVPLEYGEGLDESVVDKQWLLKNPVRLEHDLSKVSPYKIFNRIVEDKYSLLPSRWKFFHNPSLMQRITAMLLEEPVMWALLALLQRYESQASEQIKPLAHIDSSLTQTSADFQDSFRVSDAYARHAHQLLEEANEKPKLFTIQATLMLVEQAWEAGDIARARDHLYTAICTARDLNLFDEAPALYRPLARNEFIEAEEKRRAAWVCFSLDILLSDSKTWSRLVGAGELAKLYVPCDDTMLNFGGPIRCEKNPYAPIKLSEPRWQERNMALYALRVLETWSVVVPWMQNGAMREEVAWLEDARLPHEWHAFQAMQKDWPHRYGYSPFLLHAHRGSGTGQDYIDLWAVCHLLNMAIHRAYLPIWNMECYRETKDFPSNCRERRHYMLQAATNVCDMLQEIRGFGRQFILSLSPIVGSVFFAAIGVQLWLVHCPLPSDPKDMIEKAQMQISEGYHFLNDIWASPMAKLRCQTIDQLKAYYDLQSGQRAGTGWPQIGVELGGVFRQTPSFDIPMAGTDSSPTDNTVVKEEHPTPAATTSSFASHREASTYYTSNPSLKFSATARSLDRRKRKDSSSAEEASLPTPKVAGGISKWELDKLEQTAHAFWENIFGDFGMLIR